MGSLIASLIPTKQLQKLSFLLGERSGLETMYPPGDPPVQFPVSINGSREACERFLRVELICEVPNIGIESLLCLLSYSQRRERYEMWMFAASQEDPMFMHGNFEDEGQLVMISEPSDMVWGLQRMRSTFTPHSDGSVEYRADLWEPDGYRKYCSVVFHPVLD